MLFWTTVKLAIRSLLANKLRSFLAMLGIIIGVAAVIAMLALGSGAQKAIASRFEAMGTNLLIVRPAQRGSGGVMSGNQQNLTLADAEAVLKEVPGVRQVAPSVSSNLQLKYMNRNSRCYVIGTSITYFSMRNFEVEKGRPLLEGEVEGMARACVIGPTTATNLFGNDDPVGLPLKIKGINFKVVGVLKSKGDQGWFNPDDQVIVPYTTAMKQLFGLDYLQAIHVDSEDEKQLARIQTDVETLIKKRHRVLPDLPPDVNIQNNQEMLETSSSATAVMTMLLGGIAGISLLVGGIGIMNIMLVTVTERTREIGVRKAIGAKDRDILRQFLIETLMMSGMGGSIGVIGGMDLAKAIGAFTPFTPVVTPFSVMLALSFSLGVGIFFGYYPAWRAARLDPIEALRYE